MDRMCMNCTGFKQERGNRDVPSNVQGLCVAKPARPGGTKWAPVKGDDWCRDGFEAVKKPKNGGGS